MQLIILDRDGVINEDSDAYIKHPNEWHAIPGSLEAIAALKQAGYQIAVATNQSGLARGYFTIETLQAIHKKMQQSLRDLHAQIDHIVYCPHGPNAGCQCRKPAPGMLQALADYFNVQPSDCVFIGDSYKDIEAGRAFGCQTRLVLTGKGQQTLAKHKHSLQDTQIFSNLMAVSKTLI